MASPLLADIPSDTSIPPSADEISVRTYLDVNGEREVVKLIRLSSPPSPVQPGHIQDGNGDYWRISANSAKAHFFADLNGSAAPIRDALQKTLDMAVAFPGMTGGRAEFPAGTFDTADVSLTISAKTDIAAPYGDCVLQRSVDVGSAAYDNGGVRPPVLKAIGVAGVRINGVTVEMTAGTPTNPATFSSGFSAFYFSNCDDVTIELRGDRRFL